VSRALLQQYGTTWVKRRLWDSEYAVGRWTCLESMPNDCVYTHVERYAKGGSVLDLGCGPGTTGTELASHSYSSYLGVDISEVAIQRAILRAEEHDRAGTNKYVQADIFSFEPPQKYDLILFGDSLYYVPWRQIRSMLSRYETYLEQGGAFVARIYGHRYQPIIEIIEQNFDVLEKEVYADEVFVLTFQPAVSDGKQSGSQG
jgi:SAM-dependent methyltransferase